jgi:hypothetical protein
VLRSVVQEEMALNFRSSSVRSPERAWRNAEVLAEASRKMALICKAGREGNLGERQIGTRYEIDGLAESPIHQKIVRRGGFRRETAQSKWDPQYWYLNRNRGRQNNLFGCGGV